jgi:uncharacterized protein (DUF2252 family)
VEGASHNRRVSSQELSGIENAAVESIREGLRHENTNKNRHQSNADRSRVVAAIPRVPSVSETHRLEIHLKGIIQEGKQYGDCCWMVLGEARMITLASPFSHKS